MRIAHRCPVLVLTWLAMLAAFLRPATAAGPTGCITGVVLDEHSRPLANIKVEVLKKGFGWHTNQTLTNVDGVFQFPGLTPADYQIVVGDRQGPYPNHASELYNGKPAPEVSVVASDACKYVAVKLGPKAAQLNLSIVDATTKQPIEKPTFELRRPDGAGLFTGVENGKIMVPPMTQLQLKFQAVGYDQSAAINLSPLHPEEVRELMVELQPARKGCIVGTVIEEDNSPIAGAQVTPLIRNRSMMNEDHSVLTDKEGRFQINGLEVGPYYVYASKTSAGYLGTQSGGEINLLSSPPCIQFPLTIGVKAARLQITAIDAKTREEIPQIHTGYSNEERRSTYSSFVERLPGNVALVEPLRRLSITIYADGYQEGKRVFLDPLAPGETKDITVELQPAVSPDHNDKKVARH